MWRADALGRHCLALRSGDLPEGEVLVTQVAAGDKIVVVIGTNGNGSGASITKKDKRIGMYEPQISMSISDAARLLFDLKDALKKHPLGNSAIDAAHRQRRRER